MYISEGAYTFINKDRKAVAYYPVQHTVIWNIEYNVNDVSLEKTSGEGNRKIAGIVTDLNSTGEM